jgi:four helix bundle protein
MDNKVLGPFQHNQGGRAMHDFRKLEVYQRAIEYTVSVRSTVKTFPHNEAFILTPQFCRAADSIALNIAEGAGCSSQKEFSRFLGYAIRSGYECGACIDIAAMQSYMDLDCRMKLNQRVEEIIRMIVGLRKSLHRRLASEEWLLSSEKNLNT